MNEEHEDQIEICKAAQKVAKQIEDECIEEGVYVDKEWTGRMIQQAIDSERLRYDDPQWDNTDGAHPAFWRGQKSGVLGAVMVIEKVLDGVRHGGVNASKELQALRERLICIMDEPTDEAREDIRKEFLLELSHQATKSGWDKVRWRIDAAKHEAKKEN